MDSWPLKMGPIGCPETSVGNYHHSLRNNPEVLSSHLLRGRSLKSRVQTPHSLEVSIPVLCGQCECAVFSEFGQVLRYHLSVYSFGVAVVLLICALFLVDPAHFSENQSAVSGALTDGSADRRVSQIIAKSGASWVFWLERGWSRSGRLQKAGPLESSG